MLSDHSLAGERRSAGAPYHPVSGPNCHEGGRLPPTEPTSPDTSWPGSLSRRDRSTRVDRICRVECTAEAHVNALTGIITRRPLCLEFVRDPLCRIAGLKPHTTYPIWITLSTFVPIPMQSPATVSTPSLSKHRYDSPLRRRDVRPCSGDPGGAVLAETTRLP